ncbi:MAG: hypothetical protein VX973_10930 [Pseudomonadota bacterium]|nr:hypothetical protein [Pseudomonadota bacterium]MEE3093028.1 hypothetical protein [Pseudomonadota bacterium]
MKRAAAEAQGSGDFTSLWSGQATALGWEMSSGDLTRTIVEGAQMHFEKLSGN